MKRLEFFRKLADMWEHRDDKYIPGNENYVGHTEAKRRGKAK